MDIMDAMVLTFDGRMVRHKKMSPALRVHSCPSSIVHSVVHSCPFGLSCPFLSLSIVHKKSFTKKKILRDSSTKFFYRVVTLTDEIARGFVVLAVVFPTDRSDQTDRHNALRRRYLTMSNPGSAVLHTAPQRQLFFGINFSYKFAS
jgi:hypothetical protein